MNWATVFRLGIKELRGLLRDPVMIALILYAFSMAVYTEAKAMPEALRNATIAVVDEDRSRLSTRIVTAFQPPYFAPAQDITPTQMDALMDAGRASFAIDIPPGFQRDVLAGRSPAIQMNIDATRMTQAFSGSVYIRQIVQAEIDEYRARHRVPLALPVALNLHAMFNPQLNPQWFGAINNVILSITMLSIILTGAALIREKEHGTVEHLLVMPVTAAEIMLSKLWSMGLVVLAAASLAITLVVQGLLGVPIAGSIGLFLICAVLMLFATTAMGIFLATLAGSMPQFGLLLMLVLLPLHLLSGGMTPRESMPEAIQWLMLAAPNTHFVAISQAILFRGAGLSVVWPQMLALLAIGAALFWLALARFRRFLT